MAEPPAQPLRAGLRTTPAASVTVAVQGRDGSVVLRQWEISAADGELWDTMIERRYGTPDHEYLADAEAALRLGLAAMTAVQKDAVSLHGESRE